MNRAIKLIDKIVDNLMVDIGDMAIDYGIKEERTVEQQTEILALMQVIERLEKAQEELRNYQQR